MSAIVNKEIPVISFQLLLKGMHLMKDKNQEKFRNKINQIVFPQFFVLAIFVVLKRVYGHCSTGALYSARQACQRFSYN